MSYQPNISPEEAVGKARAANMYKLSANENPLGPSPKACAAIKDTLNTLSMYPPRDDLALRQALAAYNQVEPNHIVTANGGCDVLRLIALAYLDKDSSIVINTPAFPVYARSAKQVGATVIDAGLDPETFHFRPEALAAAIRPDTKAVYLCNPNNPTGTTFGQAQFDALLDAIPEDVLVVYDEVYHHFVRDMRLPDAKQQVMQGRKLVIVHSFSKAYGMAGIRVGYGVAHRSIIAKLSKQKNPFHLSSVAMRAAQAALSDEGHLARTIENNQQGLMTLRQGLEHAGVRYWDSHANFMLFEVPPGYSQTSFVDAMLEYDVMVRAAFDLDNHVRVSIGTAEGNAQFVRALHALVSSST